jgi:geranylgeranyl diphosphate synthase type I
MDLRTFRSWFDEQWIAVLDTKIHAYVSKSTHSEIQSISAYVQLLARDGKRFRPYLAYLALGQSDPHEHVELLCAIELLHLFALVHDDIMDNGTTRHGVACAHRKFGEQYHSSRIGDGVAILLGDLVFAWSYESMLSYARTHPQQANVLIDVWGELIREVIHGQMIDVISPTQPPFTQELIEQKMYLKTARYSFVQPMRLGFAAAGSLDTRNEFAETYGRALGLMFQLQDDLIDVTEGHDKSSFLDIETKQQTLLSWYMQTKAADVSKTQFAHYFGKTLTDDDKRTVATLLQESGARAYVETQIEKYYQEASMYAGTDVWKAVAAMVYQRSN